MGSAKAGLEEENPSRRTNDPTSRTAAFLARVWRKPLEEGGDGEERMRGRCEEGEAKLRDWESLGEKGRDFLHGDGNPFGLGKWVGVKV